MRAAAYRSAPAAVPTARASASSAVASASASHCAGAARSAAPTVSLVRDGAVATLGCGDLVGTSGTGTAWASA